MEAGLQGGRVVVWQCGGRPAGWQSTVGLISCSWRRPSQERRPGGAAAAEQEESELGNSTAARPGALPALPCAKTYIRAGVPRPAHGFTSGLFHRHGSGGVAARHVTTLVATWWWWEKLSQRYYSIAEKAPARLPLPSVLFLKLLYLLIFQLSLLEGVTKRKARKV